MFTEVAFFYLPKYAAKRKQQNQKIKKLQKKPKHPSPPLSLSFIFPKKLFSMIDLISLISKKV